MEPKTEKLDFMNLQNYQIRMGETRLGLMIDCALFTNTRLVSVQRVYPLLLAQEHCEELCPCEARFIEVTARIV